MLPFSCQTKMKYDYTPTQSSNHLTSSKVMLRDHALVVSNDANLTRNSLNTCSKCTNEDKPQVHAGYNKKNANIHGIQYKQHENESPKRKISEPIQFKFERSDSEIRLVQAEEEADFVDYCMYIRIANGMLQRVHFGSEIDKSLDNVIRIRHASGCTRRKSLMGTDCNSNSFDDEPILVDHDRHHHDDHRCTAQTSNLQDPSLCHCLATGGQSSPISSLMLQQHPDFLRRYYYSDYYNRDMFDQDSCGNLDDEVFSIEL